MYIEYVEQDSVVRVTAEQAAAEMCDRAARYGHHYQYQQEAIEDFVELHNAVIIE